MKKNEDRGNPLLKDLRRMPPASNKFPKVLQASACATRVIEANKP